MSNKRAGQYSTIDLPPDLEQCFTDYLQYELQLAARTVYTYGREIRRFLGFLGAEDVATITEARIQDYILMRRESGVSGESGASGVNERTGAKIISSLRQFFFYLIKEGICKHNPCLSLEMPRLGEHLPAVLSVEEIELILELIDVGSPLGLRDRCLFELIYSCGLRVSEAVDLTLDRVYAGEKLLRVIGKGGKERIIPMGDEACHWFDRYVRDGRPSLYNAARSGNFVFLNHFGGNLSRKGMWKRFRELREKVGVEAKIHTLRHSFATHLLEGGADLRSVQALLGHADISTTQIYTHLDKGKLQKDHLRYHPRGRNAGG